MSFVLCVKNFIFCLFCDSLGWWIELVQSYISKLNHKREAYKSDSFVKEQNEYTLQIIYYSDRSVNNHKNTLSCRKRKSFLQIFCPKFCYKWLDNGSGDGLDFVQNFVTIGKYRWNAIVHEVINEFQKSLFFLNDIYQ